MEAYEKAIWREEGQKHIFDAKRVSLIKHQHIYINMNGEGVRNDFFIQKWEKYADSIVMDHSIGSAPLLFLLSPGPVSPRNKY